MKFTAGFIAVVTAAAPAWAIQLTNSAYAVEAGQPFTLTWSDSEGPVTVTLKNGASTDLQTVEVLASGLTTSSFTWNPPSSLPSGTYAFEVADSSSSPNYSPQFTFQGSAAATTGSSASSSAASTSASVSTTLSSLTITSSSASATASANSSSSISSSSISSTASGNSTTTSSSSSSTRTSTRTSATSTSESTSTSTPVNTNDSQKLGSPLALILGTIVSLMIFN